ncbi:MAG: gluconate 2-dehydrogenase subunit 3 family protein [Thaumarchaeota archaeon]|nr:gluconate 2-dehydrogenase subunit 3 family protein [Nitrososphaerota archaeon]
MTAGEKPAKSSRRSFLKIGAGFVAGAAVASIVEIPYYSSVIGGKGDNDSSTVSSLQGQLNSAQDQLSSTQEQLSTAQNQISSLAGHVSSLNDQVASSSSALASANSTIASLQQQSGTSTSNPALQVQLDTMRGFLTLSQAEQGALQAATETIIPTDSNGPGATEAGVVYFIDRQLATDYGKSGNMYMQGPFVPTGLKGPVTLEGITYPGGSFSPPLGGGYSFQYSLNMRDFWRVGLVALETYSNTAYGATFESLSSAEQLQALADLWGDKPTEFGGITPSDFAWELTFMTWCGFLTDPLYGGNQNMVGWEYVAFNGTNQGNFYGEGHTPQDLMLATTATRLKPASLAQYQKGSP